MSAKDEASRLIAALPDHSTWSDVLRVISEAASRGESRMVREYRAPYGAPATATETESGEETGMGETFDVMIERDEDGYYVAWVPSLHGCHTQGDTLEEAVEYIREAIALCLEVADGRPEPTGYVGMRRVSVTI